MADPQSNAPSRADTGAPTSGVIHVRTRLTANFTVIANALAQRRGSAVTVGVAAYILSLPDGSIVSIAALCAHFDEGEILISRALRELEAAGYLERRRERGPDGQIRTRTYFHDVPRGQGESTPPPERPLRARKFAARNTPRPSTPPTTESAPDPAHPSPPSPLGLDTVDPQAVVVLSSLRILDRRLILSRREVAELAPAVTEWLARGLGPEEIAGLLTTGLPETFRSRPARVLAYRLSEVPLPAPPAPPTAAAPHPWQTCEGCERAFRAPAPTSCRDCRNTPTPRATRASGRTDTDRAAVSPLHRRGGGPRPALARAAMSAIQEATWH
ncbi:hypothetical protein [Streptomyces sp. NPDC050535]|uniref:hypothetical protein n=1 Tax=Streptomyces sp. NPDC050535 TaxID=3365626 RepID=UPI0037AE99B5